MYKDNIYFFLGSAILGVIIGLVGVNIRQKELQIIWYCICFGTLALILLKDMNNMRLAFKGEYGRAIQGFDRMKKKYGRIKIIKNTITYSIALCYYRKGEFCKSEDYLDQMDLVNCDNNLKWGFFGSRAINLILLGEHASVAEQYFEKATRFLKLEEYYPIQAYFEVVKGNQKEALKYIEGYINKKKKRKILFSFTKVNFVFDKFIYDIQNNYFLGMTYLKMNEPQLAKEYFIKASKGQYENYFSKRSEEILACLEINC